jgi:hypothetical protein
MKTPRLLLALMLCFSLCVSAEEEKKYDIKPRLPQEHGKLTPAPQSAKEGDSVTVTVEPDAGYGLSDEVFYAKKNADGGWSAPQKAFNRSSFPDDRANNKQTCRFAMPAGDVEVWAEFASLRTLIIHQTENGKLKPRYGVDKSTDKIDSNVVRNVPRMPVILEVSPKTGYQLLDVIIVNVDTSDCKKTASEITITMPNEDEIVHVTPVFGLDKYNVTTDYNKNEVTVKVSNLTPKYREEVTVEILTVKGYIPANVSITGCDSTWQVDKPERQSNGGWKVVYRFKVGLKDVNVSVRAEQVFSVKAQDQKKSNRVKTYIPEMIPGYPGVARNGQQVPVVFQMPEEYHVKFTTQGDPNSTMVYHNVLRNSFADEGMSGWWESDEYVNKGLPMKVFTDSADNKYWHTSVRNSMSQTVKINWSSIPETAKKDGKLSIAAIASINPCRARIAKVSILANGTFLKDGELIVADMQEKNTGWKTELTTGYINSQASELKFVVDAEGHNPDKSLAYEGPMFDDLCLLLPASTDTIRNENVLIFTVNGNDVTVNYSPSGTQHKVYVDKTDHVDMTLHNTVTGEEGDTVRALKDDLIVIKGKTDENYAVYSMVWTPVMPDETPMNSPQAMSKDNGIKKNSKEEEGSAAIVYKPVRLEPDSVNMDAREWYGHFVVEHDADATVTPDVGNLKIKVYNYYGGLIKVSNTKPKQGETVEITVIPNNGCTYKGITTTPADVVTIKEEEVDPVTRGGKYSFVMPTAYITMRSEFIVPITTVEQLDSISRQRGEFRLENDLDLGDKWTKDISVSGFFNGNKHRITYGGSKSLFTNVYKNGVVSQLYVKANVKGNGYFLGGIAQKNVGKIEDCEVSGTVKNLKKGGVAGGIAGQNGPKQGTISHCHVLCDGIDAAKAYGIAFQDRGATIRDNVFNGQLVYGDGDAYMITNDEDASTIENNYYIQNDVNTRARVSRGASVTNATSLLALADEWAKDYPVLAASIKSKYSNGFSIKHSLPTGVSLVNLSSQSAAAGTVVTGSVSVSGNLHLDGISVSAPDGSDNQSCKITDNMDYTYSFSFVMPAHDVKITATTKDGLCIYTPQQFADISEQRGTFYLVRDLELNSWEKNVVLNGTFDGGGHTIKYNAKNECPGLFYKIRRGAVLQGLRVVGEVETNIDCGGITYENQGIIRNCHFVGNIKKLSKSSKKKEKKNLTPDKVSAIACMVENEQSLIDHCSATATLTAPNSQDVVDKNPLCYDIDNYLTHKNITNSHWISPTQSDKYREMLGIAEAARKDYPIYAQGIMDRINPCVIVGTDTIRVENGKTLDELTIIDGKPFVCTGDVKVNRVIYKREATNNKEQWVLPFAFDRIAGNGTFEYQKMIEKDKKPDLGEISKLSLSQTATSVNYQANYPWMVNCDGSEYVLTNSRGPITITATNNKNIAWYASLMDKAYFYAAYDSIPGITTKEGLMYLWDVAKQAFVCSDSVAIEPFRYYVQFYSQNNGGFVKYGNTKWARDEAASSTNRASVAPRRMASAKAEGWQPIFLDPRQPQSVTAAMLDDYEVAYLTDIDAEEVRDENADAPLPAVSLVYQKADSYTELPKALPLLVRAKRSDAAPLVNQQMGGEIDALLLLSAIFGDDEDVPSELADFDMPHYWCASFGNRLDIWPLPSSELYADMVDTDCLMFDDNFLEQSFNYPVDTDTRATGPMSYCISVLNSDTFEPLPLLGDRVYVEFISSAGEATGIDTVKGEGFMVHDSKSYNLSGQRVGAGYKGIIIQNGRKVMKR